MRLPFQSLLLLLLVTLALFAVGTGGIISTFSTQNVSRNLSTQVMEQAAHRIAVEVAHLVDNSEAIGTSYQRFFDLSAVDFDDPYGLGKQLARDLAQQPHLTYVSLGFDNGYAINTKRMREGRIRLRWYDREMEDGKLKIWRNDAMAVGSLWVPEPRQHSDADPRKRPFWTAVLHAERPVWTDVYLLKNPGGSDYPGISCATPLRDKAGALRAVVTADFDLRDLSRYLRQFNLFGQGNAYVLALKEEGATLIAHPKPRSFMKQGKAGEDTTLLPFEDIDDTVLKSFAAALRARNFTTERGVLRYDVDRDTWMGAYEVITRDSLQWVVLVTVPEAPILLDSWRIAQLNVIAALFIALLSVLIAVYIARRVSEPLFQVAQGAARVGAFQLEPEQPPGTLIEEVHQMYQSVEEMKRGLRSFRKYVPADLVRLLLAQGNEAALGGEKRQLTLYFSDVAGFTSIAEALTPDQLLELCGHYLNEVSDQILEAGGTVDKYIGDAIMAFWNAPGVDPLHAEHACRTALANQVTLAGLRKRTTAQGLPPLHIRIGLHTGDAIVGNVGSNQRLDYTAIGDSVNIASRLEGLNKVYGSKILISETTVQEAGTAIVARPLERVAVKGKRLGLLVFELMAMDEGATPHQRHTANRFQAAYDLARKGSFQEARDLYAQCVSEDPADVVAAAMVDRMDALLADPPPADWDGVRQVHEK